MSKGGWKMRLKVLLALLVVSTVGVGAWADDLNPPPWRGQPGTTFGRWEFLTPDPQPLPDVGNYPYGPPSTTITPGIGQNWLPMWEGREGVWPLSGEIFVDIPNRPEPLPYKDIWIQLTWAQQAPNVWPVVSEVQFGVPATLINEVPLEGVWIHSTYKIRLEPNPAWETILITGAVNVDELVIDTICAPEPTSLVLFGLGVFSVLRRRLRA
jgi:hypothetical protein